MYLPLSIGRNQRLMGGSHRHGREPCTPTLVHGGTLSHLLLILVSSSTPTSPSAVCCSGWSDQGLQVVQVDVASSSISGWWTGVSEEGSTMQCSGESAGGGGEEAAAGVHLPFPRPPPALPLPVFFRPPLPLGTSSVEGGGEEILSIKDLRRARGGSALPRPLPREPEVSPSISVTSLPRIKIK